MNGEPNMLYTHLTEELLGLQIILKTKIKHLDFLFEL